MLVDDVVPVEESVPFEIHDLIDGVVDADSFFELKPLFAAEVVTGFARLDGRPVGVVANNSAVRGGVLFVRDLLRPVDAAALEGFVKTYAADANAHQQKMFAESLHAALRLEEVRGMVTRLGFDEATVQQTSDRHWTWSARK